MNLFSFFFKTSFNEYLRNFLHIFLVAILKPNSSRPANAERYLICCNLKKGTQFKKIKSYLWVIVNKFWEYKDEKNWDLLEIVPRDIIKRNKKFYNYVIKTNNR